MKKTFFIVIAVLFTHSMQAQNRFSYVERDTAFFVEKELIIRLEPGVDAKEFAANSQQKIVPKRLLAESWNTWLFEFTDSKEQRSMEERNVRMSNLASNANVRHVQNSHTNITLRSLIPNDTHYNLQWAPAKIGLPEVWDEFTTGGVTADGDEIVVAVIDDGFDLNHTDMNFWKNIHEIPNNGIDDDNNGYIDDYDGWNAYNQTGTIYVNYHGTHVAGIVGAIGNNKKGVSGVNWNVGILPVAGSSGYEPTVVEAYHYVYKMRKLYNETNGQKGAFIVATNSSFGVDWDYGGIPANYPEWCAMYDDLGSVGILSCAATANANWNIDQVGDVPTACSSPFLISVTNTTSADVKNTVPGAGYGVNTIDIGAPGTNIYSTIPYSTYGYDTGTSMATPHVAGVIALMYAAMPQSIIQTYKRVPANFALLVKQLLLDGADRILSLNGLVASGRLNAYNAVNAATCSTINLTGTISAPHLVNSNKSIVSCGDINVQHVVVANGTTLTMKTAGNIDIQDMVVYNNSSLILEAAGNIDIQGVEITDGSTMTSDADGDINVRDVLYVDYYSELILKAAGDIDIQGVEVFYGSTMDSYADGDINVREVYVINNSKLILKAAGNVTIERDFEVELGSELEIQK